MANREGYTSTKRFDYLEESDFCPHVTADNLKEAVGYFYENDSFGPVYRLIVCKDCKEAQQAIADEAEVNCIDCLKAVATKNVLFWKWYDFDFNQGDEPLRVCHDCVKGGEHKARVAKDNTDYNSEMGYEDTDDCDD